MTKTNPTDILREEHEMVLQILNSLEQNLPAMNMELLSENIAVLNKEFDKHSLQKEETALFPEIEKFIPREGGPTGMMIVEHQELVDFIGKFKQALAANDSDSLNECGRHIIDVLRQHIDKENNILFNMADMHFSDEQKDVILKKFKQIDQERK